MPSHRKRIGFLPSENVHDLIDKICKENKYSQSKVTGILVEEALRSRGLICGSFSNNDNDSYKIENNSDESNKFDFKNQFSSNENFSSINTINFDEDLIMINDYIEYKFFKKVMKQNNKFLDK